MIECDLSRTSPEELLLPRNASGVPIEFNHIAMAKLMHLHYLETLSCLQDWEKVHGKGALLLFHFLKDILHERKDGRYKNEDELPEWEEMQSSVYQSKYRKIDKISSLLELKINQLVTKLKSNEFLEQFYGLSWENRMELKDQLLKGLSLTINGRSFLSDCVQYEPEGHNFFNPMTSIKTYTESTPVEARAFLPIFCIEALEYDLIEFENNLTSFSDELKAAKFFFKIINKADDLLSFALIFKKQKIFFTIGRTIDILFEGIDKMIPEGIHFFRDTNSSQRETLEKKITEIVGKGFNENVRSKLNTALAGINLLFAGITFYTTVNKNLINREGEITIRNGFDLFSSTTLLAKEIIDFYTVVRRIDTTTEAFGATRIGRTLKVLKGTQNYVIGPIVFLIAIQESSSLYQGGKTRAATSSLAFGLAAISPTIGVVVGAAGILATVFAVVVPLVLIGIGLLYIFAFDSDKMVRFKDWFLKNYFGKEWALLSLNGIKNIKPVDVNFEWINPDRSINFGNQISTLKSMLLPPKLSILNEAERLNEFPELPSHYYSMTLELNEPALPLSTFYLRIRFFNYENEEYSKKWNISTNTFTDEDHSFIIPINPLDIHQLPWSVFSDGFGWYQRYQSVPKYGEDEENLQTGPIGVENLKVHFSMPIKSSILIEYIGVEILMTDIFKYENKSKIEQVFKSSENLVLIKEFAKIEWDQWYF